MILKALAVKILGFLLPPSELELLRAYIWRCRMEGARKPGFWRVPALLPYFFRWKRTLAKNYPLLDAAEPWIPFACADFLKAKIRSGWKIFEYGAGGSTLFFATLGAEGVSAEHDPAWAEQVRQKLNAQPGRKWEVLFVPPAPEDGGRRDPADPALFHSAYPGYETLNFRLYAAAIDAYPDHSFDLVLVDGRARPSCLLRAVSKIKNGGFLVLDDSDRAHYGEAMTKLPAAWRKRVFRGPKAATPNFCQSTLWQAR